MRMIVSAAKIAVVLVGCLASLAASAQTKKDLKFTVPQGASVSIINDFGTVNVHPSAGRVVQVTATQNSDKVEIVQNQSGNRLEVRTHPLQQHLSPQDGRVDFEVTVPTDVALTVRSSDGPISVERLRGDVSAEGDTATVDIHDVSNGHVHVRSMSGPVKLANITNGHIEITSVSGPVTMTNVSGPKIEVNTTNGKIVYTGNFASDGDYSFTNHNADIDVFVPANASADISARSVKGSVENDLQVSPSKLHVPSFAAKNDSGRSFAGTINSGASSVQIRSFSGKIRVKKQ
jgi:DUF4097 and DUF4098 domain-containing protein YvlB